ncbi:MAG: GC-type dockerin domain-anchored protein [Phycisphaerales bacterium]
MAITTRTILISTLALSSGAAIAGEHGESYSTCGTEAHAQPRQLLGAGIYPVDSLEYRLTPSQIEALNEPQKDLLKYFESKVFEGEMAPHVCMHPDTDPEVAQAFEQFLNDMWFENTPNAFILSTRWTSTATNGSGLSQGDPTTLTYSVIPDGTNISGEGASNLISFLNTRIGSGTWPGLMQTALDAWGNVSGLNYVLEPNDTGSTMSNPGPAGVLGVRGDVRIGGQFIDGNSGVLAYNRFPNSGDMVIDTGDGAFYGSSSGNYIRFRNVLTHEAGHGIGLSHVESDSDRFLMEPFIDISFTGPQMDDIRGAQRGYGDIDENNNSYAQGTDLNGLALGGTAFEGGDFKVISFRSIDDNSDVDYYRLTTGEPVTMVVSVAPQGGSYQFTAQGSGGGGSFFNADAVLDLNFRVINSSGTTIANIDNTSAGSTEFASVELPDVGDYAIIIDSNNTNNIQLYGLTVSFTTLDVPDECPADFTGEGDLNFLDVSAFLSAFGNQEPEADFQPDGNFNFLDVSAYLSAYGDGCP